jgi:hypothetical protein
MQTLFSPMTTASSVRDKQATSPPFSSLRTHSRDKRPVVIIYDVSDPPNLPNRGMRDGDFPSATGVPRSVYEGR